MTRLLALLCGLLIAVIAVEMSHRHGGDDHLGAGLTAATGVTAPAVRATSRVQGSRDQWARTVLARPLFAPDRKPSGDPSAGNVGLPRLAGIISSGNEAMAIFQPTGNVKPVVARHGDVVAGWEVTTVALDAVSLRKADDRIVLRPRFNGAEAAGVSAESKQPRQRWEVAAPTGMLRARWSNPQLQP